ncbi:MAG: ribonuclease Y [Candidatus Babeliales bacterium]
MVLAHITALIASIAGLVLLVALIFLWYARSYARRMTAALAQAQEQMKDNRREIENERKEAHIKLKDELYKKKNEFELDLKRERLELERFQTKINAKAELLEKKEQRIEEISSEVQHKERNLARMSDKVRVHEQKLKTVYDNLVHKLENIAGTTKEHAYKELTDCLQADVQMSNEKWIQKVEDDARHAAKEKANQIVVTAMQRYVSDQVTPHSSGVVHLPNEEMKGRIIGKEGRNIKSLEMTTGMEFVIGETPEIITISGFNPIRREVARRSLEKLIADGRINPSRIEETVNQCEKEIDEMIEEMGKEAVLEMNLQGMHTDLVTLLGKLYFRTSFSQNVLQHSKEVALFARMIADELGLDGSLALRAGLLHDIGKAVSAEVEGPHALIGADIAKRCGEDSLVVNAIAAHHEEVLFSSIYGPIVVVADTISASRPGARRETLSTYIKRLEKLEEIANHFEGVKKSFALQAGREIRIIVEEEFVDDERACAMARDIARAIEKEMSFPGQIKVNVIREKRSIEYAR